MIENVDAPTKMPSATAVFVSMLEKTLKLTVALPKPDVGPLMVIALGFWLYNTQGQPCGTVIAKEDVTLPKGTARLEGEMESIQDTAELKSSFVTKLLSIAGMYGLLLTFSIAPALVGKSVLVVVPVK